MVLLSYYSLTHTNIDRGLKPETVSEFPTQHHSVGCPDKVTLRNCVCVKMLSLDLTSGILELKKNNGLCRPRVENTLGRVKAFKYLPNFSAVLLDTLERLTYLGLL